MLFIRYGDEGLFVRYIQVLLKRAGEDPGSTDGVFASRTLRALTAFQSRNGLQPDGRVGILTLSALYRYLIGSTFTFINENETIETIARKFQISIQSVEIANSDLKHARACERIVVPLAFDVVFQDIPYSSFLTSAVIEGLCLRYPFIERSVIGKSVMGSEIEMIRIGKGSYKLGVNAAHHANEWITTPMSLMFIEQYAKAYADNGSIGGFSARDLYEHTTLCLVPLVNPDGADLVNGFIKEGNRYYNSAKALASYYPNVPFPSGWKANICGIDLNLGYPAGWEQARTMKRSQGYTKPGPRDYTGMHPLEAPENIAMYEMTKRVQFDCAISYHTQGKEIYWKYQDIIPNGSRSLADRFAKASGYQLADVPFNSGFAGYKDWFITSFRKSAFTIEAGKGRNPLPISDLKALYIENEGILTAALSNYLYT